MTQKMKMLICFVVMILCVSVACAEGNSASASDTGASEFVFRNGIKLGMTQKEVLALEESTPVDIDNGSILYSNMQAAGKTAGILYMFRNDSLVSILVIFTESHTNENLYIKDFESVKESLNAKYGEPSREGQLWFSDTYKSDQNRWGFAVSTGDLVYFAQYNPSIHPNLEISHSLYGDNYEILHALVYSYPHEGKYNNTDGI